MIREALTYDDVLLVPQYSDIESRKEVSIGNWLDEERGLWFDLPLIASPMDTVCEDKMAIAIGKMGGLGIVHRYNTIEQQVKMASNIFEKLDTHKVGFAIGITGDYLNRARALVEDEGAKILCLDVAHGDHILMKKALITLREKLGNGPHLMAGNVATLEGVDHLADWGANSIRIGIGGGSICSTRIQTGHGVPSLDSVMECSKTFKNVAVIADGGIRNSGDIVKALGVGCDFAMLGSVLAGSSDTPGQILVSEDGKQHKVYRGMASKDAQIDWRGKTSSLEGISTTIPYKGSTSEIIDQLENGIRSGLSYSGARSIRELWAKAKFIKQTSAGTRESDTHILHRN